MAGMKRTYIAVPLDIVLSLLRPDELAKLQKYIASYLGDVDRSSYNTGTTKTVSIVIIWNGDMATYAWTRRCVPLNDRTCQE